MTTTNPARSCANFCEISLNLLQGPSFCLWHQHKHKYKRAGKLQRIRDKRARWSQRLHHTQEGLRDDEGAAPVDKCGHATGQAARGGGEDLRHEQPRDGPEPQREGHDVRHQAAQRQHHSRGGGHRLLEGEVEGEHEDGGGHPRRGHHEQHPPPGAVHQPAAHPRHHHLREGDGERADVRVADARLLEDARAV
eukprot:CAMPEP_0118945982 /NCGR_PEP_ID=MMETSP1169-20130426/43378_1 /TAXON_ID=36882 /ORGANISM="Pyramimonas obovata, Strain CCMP722" /LENGTH=192 /DNA_ID=CAMNT_0006891843 /DNA_START=178 /DNA_END=753 /DNA_ORIENTATION=-